MSVVMGQKSFDKLIEAYNKNTTYAYGWPLFLNRSLELQNDIAEHGDKYINWLLWIYITAPSPKSKEEEICKVNVENYLCEVLSVEGEYLMDAIERRLIR